MKRLLAASSVASLALAAGALAAVPIYWAPAKMARALTALQYPHAGTLGGRCTGIGRSVRGGYTGFRCVMAWHVVGTDGTATASGSSVAYARPMLKGRVCGSAVSLRSCRPLAAGPLAGDPRVCSLNDAAKCAEAAAEIAASKHVGGPGGTWQGLSFTCTLVGTLKYTCPLDQVYTVTFVKGVSQWTAVVTP